MNTYITRASSTRHSLVAMARAAGVLSMLLLLAACSSKVTVVSEIPAPLVERVPLNVYMSYTEEFKNQVYVENEKRRALASLDFADAQVNMFNTVFTGLATLVAVDDPSRDLTIEPQVLEFQYTAPGDTSLKQYEIWIKYRLKLLDSENAKLADWTIKGYGKTPTALLTSATKAFNSAANIALRDVGAQLSTRFAGQARIKALISQKQNNAPVSGRAAQTAALSQSADVSDAESPPDSANAEANNE